MSPAKIDSLARACYEESSFRLGGWTELPESRRTAYRQQARRLLGLPVEAAPVGLLLAGARARRRGAHIVALRERETA